MDNGIPDGIIEKIQKLQALADNAGTEFEAALAADRVAELCRRHNLDIGVARLEREETTASTSQHVTDSKVWAAHQSNIAAACEKLFNVGCYKGKKFTVIKNADGVITGQKVTMALTFYGLKASVTSALVTYEYLLASVESMLEGWMNSADCVGTGAADRRSFRMGCARRIYDEALKIHQASANLLTGSDLMALVRLENQLLKAFAKEKRLTKGGSYSGAANRNAYNSGYQAGGRVDIHGARSSRMLR